VRPNAMAPSNHDAWKTRSPFDADGVGAERVDVPPRPTRPGFVSCVVCDGAGERVTARTDERTRTARCEVCGGAGEIETGVEDADVMPLLEAAE